MFVHEQKFPLEVEEDGQVHCRLCGEIISYMPYGHLRIDAYATHFLLKLVPSQIPIGTIRMHKPPGVTYYKLTRLAVIKQYRKHRLGAALVQRAHQFAVHDHVKSSGLGGPVKVIAHSQIPVKPFYER